MAEKQQQSPDGLDACAWVKQKGIYFKHGSFYWVHRNRWHRLGRTIEEANARRVELLNASHGISGVSLEFLEAAYWKAKSRAKRKSVEFSLTLADVHSMWDENRGRCALSSIPMNESNPERLGRRPFIPSLHRMNPREGYTLSNTRLVCFAVNAALNAWGDSVFRAVATGYLRKFPISEPA